MKKIEVTMDESRELALELFLVLEKYMTKNSKEDGSLDLKTVTLCFSALQDVHYTMIESLKQQGITLVKEEVSEQLQD